MTTPILQKPRLCPPTVPQAPTEATETREAFTARRAALCVRHDRERFDSLARLGRHTRHSRRDPLLLRMVGGCPVLHWGYFALLVVFCVFVLWLMVPEQVAAWADAPRSIPAGWASLVQACTANGGSGR